MNIPRNFFIAMTGFRFNNEMSLPIYYGVTILFQTLSYPFLTVQKRLEMRSKIAGFLPEN